ncbi:MAG: hypothetical protein J7M38_04410 [Armatimonadetes bacterium]|nr:hypothetical protein [Armatimonadota bacterium]
MSRTYCLVACAVLVVLMLVPANAETARTLGMGDTHVAVDNTASAWVGNPALLPYVDGASNPNSPWPAAVEFTAALGSEVPNIQFVDISLHDAARVRGFGAGYQNWMGDGDVYGFGYGQLWNLLPGLSVGLSGTDVDFSPWFDEFMFNFGMAYQYALPTADLTFGVVVRDVTDRMDTEVDLGAAAALPGGFTIALDIVDIGDDCDVNVGGEWVTGPLSLWVGSSDSDFTAGAQYNYDNWHVSFAYQDWDGADAYFGGGGLNF